MSEYDRMRRREQRKLARRRLDHEFRRFEERVSDSGPMGRALITWQQATTPRFLRKAIYRIAKRLNKPEEKPEQMKREQPAAYGNPIPRAFGRVGKIEGNVIYASDFSAGIGNGNILPNLIATANAEGEEQPVYVTCAVAVCQGPVSAITRIWANGILIHRTVGETPGYTAGYADYSDSISIYLGTETQTADPFLEALEGAGDVPGYRGLAYVVFHGFNLKNFNNAIPRFEFEVLSTASVSYPTESLALAALAEDAMVPSRQTPLLYCYESSAAVLTAVSRVDFSITFVRSVQSLLDLVDTAGANITDGFAIDEGSSSDDIYFFARTGVGNKSFFLRLRTQIGMFDSNFSIAEPGAQESVGIGLGEFFFTANATGAAIRAYRKPTLTAGFVRLWRRGGPDANAIPGNFTYDHLGRLWLISWLASDPSTGPSSRFWLTRVTTAGEQQIFEITGQGNCKQVAFSNQPLTSGYYLVCGGGDSGNLVRVTVDGSVSFSLNNVCASDQSSLWRSQIRFDNHRLLCSDMTSLFRVNTDTMAIAQTIGDAEHGLRLFGVTYDRARDTIYSAEDASSGTLTSCQLDRFSADTITVGTVISDLCQAAGLSAGDISASSVSIGLDGYVISGKSTARQALEMLMVAYQMHARQSGSVIEFKSISSRSANAIPTIDLGMAASPEPEPYQYELREADDLPAQVTLLYPSRDRDYAEVAQTAKRRADVFPGQAEVEVRVDVVLSDAAARQLAENLVYSAERERLAYPLFVGPYYMRFDAGDFFSFTLSDGQTEAVRGETMEVGEDLSIRIAAVRVDADAYGSILTGSGPESFEELLEADAPVAAVVLDVPCFRDMDDQPGVYWGATPIGQGRYLGARLEQSLDGVSFAPAQVVNQQTVIGYVETRLETVAEGATSTTFDAAATIDLQLLAGTLSSATEDELYDDRLRNLLAVGTIETGWELVQFATATDLGDGRWRATGLLRGRFGTEWRMDLHAVGEQLVVIDLATMGRLKIAPAQIGQELVYRAASITTPDIVGVTFPLQFEAVCKKPWAPVELTGNIQGSSPRDWYLFWQRRPRVGGGWVDSFDVPVGEPEERYEVEIIVGGNIIRTLDVVITTLSGVNLSIASGDQSITRASGSWYADGFLPGAWIELSGFSNAANNGIFKIASASSATKLILSDGTSSLVTEASAADRTARLSSPCANYTEAMQTADTGSIVFNLSFKVYQISAVVGRGYASGEVSL